MISILSKSDVLTKSFGNTINGCKVVTYVRITPVISPYIKIVTET